MRDELNRNPMVMTGTPTLIAGALTVDTNSALSFNGPTTFASATDSTSLSITGSLSIELFLWLDALPGATRDIVRKTGSYSIQVNSSGIVIFNLTGTSGSVSLSSNVALTTNRWYHIVCVYNGNYAGVQRFGKSSLGSSNTQVDDDNGNNKAVSEFTLLEPALLNTVNISLQYVDEIWPVQMQAVVYADDGAGNPGALVTSSAVSVLTTPNPQWRVATWVPFTLTPALVPAGTYFLGYIADTIAGIPKAPLIVGYETTGSDTRKRPDSVGSPSDPFGASVITSIQQLAAYCDYTAVGRTGNEGKALIYLDGALNVSGAYSSGIADTTNALEVTPAVAAKVDELSIWDKPLTGRQVATHYTAH